MAVENPSCQVCGQDIPSTGRPGRRPSFCGDDCRVAWGRPKPGSGQRRRNTRAFLPCSGCGKPMQVTWTSAAVMTCNPCRRLRREADRPAPDPGPWEKICAAVGCRKPFTAEKRSRRFCSQDCLVNNHRAMERIRDAERRASRRSEIPAPALAWHGDFEANALIQGPPVSTVTVLIRTGYAYDVRCPECHWLTQFVSGSGDPGAWGCHQCYIKYALLEPPTDSHPFGSDVWHVPPPP